MNIILIGFMGCGKSTVARFLNTLSGYSIVDTDKTIENEENLKIKDMFQQHGEAYFRNKETELLENIQNQDKCIISTGGGMPITSKNQDLLKKNGLIYFLNPSFDTLWKRIERNPKRPLAQKGLEHVKTLFDERFPIYMNLAHNCIDTDKISPKITAKEIWSHFQSCQN